MHVLGRKKGVFITALLAALVSASFPSSLAAKPAPGYQPSGFRLFTRAAFRWVGNRTQCFLSSAGQICTAESSVTGGGYWPAGTNNQYIFNSGLQVAGRVDPNSAGNSWAGDVDGAFFFNARGGGNGQQITEIYNSADPADLGAWPTAAYVPCNPAESKAVAPPATVCNLPLDATSALYDSTLQGEKTASDNDIWFVSWEGDPSLSGGRSHPLGLLVETRGLAYNTPGKNDFLFFIYTFYNVTAAGNSAAYNNAPPRMQQILRDAGDRFLALNRARGATLPDAGYTLQEMFLAFGADMDVTFEESGTNYASVNVPMAMGYTYHSKFTAPSSWTFDPTIYRPPFFQGSGFIGVKYLKSPEVNGQQVGLTLFGSTSNGGQFSDPRNTQALYRYLTGNLDPTQADDQCNVGDVTLTKICYINIGAPADMRFFQSSGPLTLGPGEYSSIAVSYIFAPPVGVGACTAADACGDVRPNEPTQVLTRMLAPDSIILGVNTVDSITGYRGYLGDRGPQPTPTTPDGLFNTYDLDVVPGSLLGKAAAAQEVFDKRFVQPTPPKAPNFYLVPGDRQVAIVWQKSDTETQGDPFTSGTDPNYRKFDVAGYRVYRGNRADASSLQLLAQFDLAGDVFYDVTGQVNSTLGTGFTDCAPELGVFVAHDYTADGTEIEFDCTDAGVNTAGVNLIDSVPVSLDEPVIQWQEVLPSGTHAFVNKSDTALTGAGRGFPALSGTGVPFVFVDRAGSCSVCGVQNGVPVFYIVSAFDINSIRSGPSSLESNLSGARRVVPNADPSNLTSNGSLGTLEILGDDLVPLTDNTVPTVNANGQFTKAFPPANGASMAFVGDFVTKLFKASGSVTAKLVDLVVGDARNGIDATYTFLVTASTGDTASVVLTMPMLLDGTDAVSETAPFLFAHPDDELLQRYGIPTTYNSLGVLRHAVPSYQPAVAWGRGCFDASIAIPAGFNCLRNAARWFEGANETAVHPAAANTGPTGTTFNNAGALTGVTTIYQPVSSNNLDTDYRTVEATMGAAARAADFELTWGTAGKIASVRDVTHNVDVPFDPTVAYGFAVMTQANSNSAGSFDARPGVLTIADWGCTTGIRTGNASVGWNSYAPCTAATDFPVTDSVVLGTVAIHNNVRAGLTSAAPLANQGFSLWIAGRMFIFEMTGNALPAAGTVWKLRTYTGTIFFNPTTGEYRFRAVTRPFTAVGATMRVPFTAVNSIAGATKSDLRQVHTVPDPYYVTTRLEPSTDNKIIKFVNLPTRAIIRIYSASGVLVRTLEHNSVTASELTWDVRNRNGQFVASGVYFYHIEAINARRVGRMTVVNFAK